MKTNLSAEALAKAEADQRISKPILRVLLIFVVKLYFSSAPSRENFFIFPLRSLRPLRPNNFLSSSCSSYLRGSIFCFFFPLSTVLLITCSPALAPRVLLHPFALVLLCPCVFTAVLVSKKAILKISRGRRLKASPKLALKEALSREHH